MIEAAAHPQASERAPRPPPPSRVPRRAEDWDQARARVRGRDPHGSSGALHAPRRTGLNCQAWGWRSAHRDVREVETPPTLRQRGVGPSEAPPAPPAMGGAGDPRRGAGPTKALPSRRCPRNRETEACGPLDTGSQALWSRGSLVSQTHVPRSETCRDRGPQSQRPDRSIFLYKRTPWRYLMI